MTELESRVARLERQLRVQSRLSVLGLLALVALTGWGALPATPAVIRAHRIEVVNAGGRPLVTLLTNEYGGLMQTLGSDGVSGVTLGASSTGGVVGVRDGKPSLFPRVELSTDDTGGQLAVRNWRGFALQVDRDGLAVAHTHEDGNFTRSDARVVLSVDEHGGHVRVLSGTGQDAATLRADERGVGVVTAFDRDGKSSELRP
jgi:hypothetical protein